MPELLVTLHSLMRWLVLAALILAVIRSARGLAAGVDFGPGDDKAGRWATLAVDVQLLIGLVLFAVSPLTRAAMADFGGAMADRSLRFFTAEHTLLMLMAVVAVHVGRARSRRATGAAAHKAALVGFGLGLALILAGIPWPGLPYGRPLLP